MSDTLPLALSSAVEPPLLRDGLLTYTDRGGVEIMIFSRHRAATLITRCVGEVVLYNQREWWGSSSDDRQCARKSVCLPGRAGSSPELNTSSKTDSRPNQRRCLEPEEDRCVVCVWHDDFVDRSLHKPSISNGPTLPCPLDEHDCLVSRTLDALEDGRRRRLASATRKVSSRHFSCKLPRVCIIY
jgi:hypothetical protein